MEIHPTLKDFIEAPISYDVKIEDKEIDVEKWKENFEKVNEMINAMTPEEKERAKKLAHESLFGKS